MDEYVRDFVQESEANVTELNNALLELEQEPGDEEAMDRIFRMAHTLKGNAGAMGFDEASDLAHAIEDLLDAVRSDEMAVSADLMDDVFAAVDEFESMLDDVREHGEIRTDPSDTLERLRSVEADATGARSIAEPTEETLVDAVASASTLDELEHTVYHVRMAVVQDPDANNGALVVDALEDAFDLLGTVPDRTAVDTDETDGRIDAVFGSAVTPSAIEAALEPVDAVDDWLISDVTDQYHDAARAPPTTGAATGDEAPADDPAADIDETDAQEMEVDELLGEFDEYDDLDALVEEMDDVSGFDDLGEAGSFDDLDLGEDLEPVDEPSSNPLADDGLAGDDDLDLAGDDDLGLDALEDEQSDDEDVEDAAETFAELKQEVDPVGFDELQDELDELEFDEYSDEEEVGFDELLGDDFEEGDDEFFGGDVGEGAVDDILVDEETTVPGFDEADSADADAAADAGDATADASPPDAEATVEAVESIAADSPGEADSSVAAESGAEADSSADADGSTSVGVDEPGSTDEPTTAETAEAAAATDTAETTAAAEAAGDADATTTASSDDAGFGSTSDTGGFDDDFDDGIDDDFDDGFDGDGTDDGFGDGIEADGVDDFDLDGADPDSETSLGDAVGRDDGFAADEVDDVVAADEPAATSGDADEFGGADFDTGDLDAEEFGVEEELDLSGDEEGARSTAGPLADANAADLDNVEVGEFSLDEADAAAAAADADVQTDDFGADADATGDDAGGGVDYGTVEADGFDDVPADADAARSATAPEGEMDPEAARELVHGTLPRSGDDDGDSEVQSIRVDVDQVDRLLNLVEGLVTNRVRLRRSVEEGASAALLDDGLDDLEEITGELQDTVMDIRLVPLKMIANKLPRVVRDVSRDQGKQVDFEMDGEDVEMDRTILDEISDPLVHLVRNAVDHGIESPEDRANLEKSDTGTVTLRAERARDRVIIEVEDDGRGLDPNVLRDEAVEEGILGEDEAEALSDTEARELVFHPGLSTAPEVTDVSGRGVGMDVVSSTVEELDGEVEIESEDGEGTTIRLVLPVSVAIDDVLFVRCGDEEFGVPTKVVRDIASTTGVEQDGDHEVVRTDDGEETPLIRLGDALEAPGAHAEDGGMLLHVRGDVRDVALHCDRVQGQQEVVVKPYDDVLGGIPGLSGATVLGEGEVVNILDVKTL